MIVSVIIPTRNRADYLRHTLLSLCRQTAPTREFEVIVIDDGSTDDTAKVCLSFQTRMTLRYTYQRHIGHRVASTRNKGIQKAKGQLLVLLDSGMIASEVLIDQYVSEFQRHQKKVQIGASFGFELSSYPKGYELVPANWQTFSDVKNSIHFKQCTDIRYEYYSKYGWTLSGLPAPWAFFWTCNVAVPRICVDHVGLFDTYLQSWGGEDIDLGYRLFAAGFPFEINRGAEALHIPHERDVAKNAASDKKNHAYICSKHQDPGMNCLLESSVLVVNDTILLRRKEQHAKSMRLLGS